MLQRARVCQGSRWPRHLQAPPGISHSPVWREEDLLKRIYQIILKRLIWLSSFLSLGWYSQVWASANANHCFLRGSLPKLSLLLNITNVFLFQEYVRMFRNMLRIRRMEVIGFPHLEGNVFSFVSFGWEREGKWRRYLSVHTLDFILLRNWLYVADFVWYLVQAANH